MGMFDYFKCSADIGALKDVCCQRKDINESIGGSLFFYWVDPNGGLWYSDYSGTRDFAESEDENAPIWAKFFLVPNGNRGRMGRVYLTKTIVIYDYVTQPDGHTDWIFCELTFAGGQLTDFSYV